MEATAVMAKKPAKKKTGPKPTAEGPRTGLIAIKCREAYKEWVVAAAKSQRITPSQLFDQAAVLFAEKHGIKPPPER